MAIPDAKLVLASASPRRLSLIEQVGIYPDLLNPVDIDETQRKRESPRALSLRLAREKAQAARAAPLVRNLGEQVFVLAADTVVEIDGDVLGKPANSQQAAVFLARLSERKHKVHTAVALVTGNNELSEISSSEVEFTALSEQTIAAYVATGEPLDKAGAYAIQGIAGQFVVNLNGSYSGVMGLPLYETAKLFSACGELAEFNFFIKKEYEQ